MFCSLFHRHSTIWVYLEPGVWISVCNEPGAEVKVSVIYTTE